MIETKVVRENAEFANEVIEEHQCFGWQVQKTESMEYANNYDDVRTKTTFTGKVKGFDITQHREIVSRVAITFVRDTEMPKIHEFRRLEQKYADLQRRRMAKEEEGKRNARTRSTFNVVAIIVLLACCLIFPLMDSGKEALLIGAGVLGALIVLPLILFNVSESKKWKNLKREIEKIANHETEVLREAARLRATLIG